jgi:hypothetical protein
MYIRHGIINYSIQYTPKLNVVIKKIELSRDLRQVFITLRPPPLQGLCLGWSSSFVGSESGQVQSVKLLQNMVSNNPQPPSHTLSVHTVL